MPDEKTLWVKATATVGPRVVLWETDPRHPNGEVFIAGAQAGQEATPVEVAETQEILRLMREGALEQTPQPRNAKELRAAAQPASGFPGEPAIQPPPDGRAEALSTAPGGTSGSATLTSDESFGGSEVGGGGGGTTETSDAGKKPAGRPARAGGGS